MSDYNNGQIWGWNGGECPVHPKTVVRYWLRSGRTSDENTACALRWCHNESDGDIIAFQVIQTRATLAEIKGESHEWREP